MARKPRSKPFYEFGQWKKSKPAPKLRKRKKVIKKKTTLEDLLEEAKQIIKDVDEITKKPPRPVGPMGPLVSRPPKEDE